MAPLRAAALLFFTAYAVIQYAGKTYHPKREYFPFFSWSLFTEVRNDVWDIRVEVTRVGDTIYDPPVDYFSLPEVFPSAAKRDSGVIKAARNLPRVADDPVALRQNEATFITSFVSVPEDVEFQIVRIRFNPVERWTTGNVQQRRVLTQHSTEGFR